MYYIISYFENVAKFVRIQLKLFYWKLKYGKRLKIGKNFRFRKGLIINITKDGYLQIGDNCFFNNYCSINCHKKIVIGNDNIFGENVKIYDHNHIFNNKSLDMKKEFRCNEVYIGNKNWFGSNTIVLSKANIQNENVISAGMTINDKHGSYKIIRSANTEIEEEIIYKNKESK